MPLDPFRAALVTETDPLRAAEALADALEAQGTGGTLGFLYATDRLKADLAPIAEILAQRTGVTDWVGTIGFGVIGGGDAAYSTPGLAAMIADWPRDQFTLYDKEPPQPIPATGIMSGMPTAIVHVDPRRPFEEQLQAIAARSSAYLVGGLTASRTKRYDQLAGKLAEGGTSGVVLGPDIAVAIGVSQGCSAIGPVREITDIQENLVAALDGEAALQALLADLAVTEGADLRELLLSLHVGLPVPHCDTGDYVVRNIIGINTENGRIGVGDHVEVGQKMFFCRRDRAAATKDLLAMAERLRKRNPAPRGALYVSCCARGPNMFESAADEVALVRSVLGEVPLVGFYANGEISGDRIYGYTGVLALF
jgi:small ligand-binding sensory domain FIST